MKENYCLTCFKKFSVVPLRQLVEKSPLICDDCLQKIKNDVRRVNIKGINILFLSHYESIMKSWLMNYKEYKDYELAKVFLYPFLPIIKLLFHHHIFIPCPSSKTRIENRGFDHLEEILKNSNLNYLNILRKKDDIQQKNKRAINRLDNMQIEIDESKKNGLISKKVVLFDDVYTTGKTFFSCVDVLKKLHVKKIKGLIILNNYKEDILKIR